MKFKICEPVTDEIETEVMLIVDEDGDLNLMIDGFNVLTIDRNNLSLRIAPDYYENMFVTHEFKWKMEI